MQYTKHRFPYETVYILYTIQYTVWHEKPIAHRDTLTCMLKLVR